MQLRFILALALVAQLGLVPALAQPIPPRVWLGPLRAPDVPGASLIAQKFDEALRKELRKAKTYRLVGESEPSQRFAAGRSDPRIEEAESMRAAGKAALATLDLGVAYVALKGALERYEATLPSLGKPEVLVSTLALLGATALADGADKEANDWFLRAATIWPEADIEGLDGEANIALKGHQQDVLRFRKGRLKVTTVPSGATIRVNGVEVGTSPVTVKAMAEGTHYVQAAHDTEGLAAGKATVARRRGKIQLVLEKELGPPNAISPPTSVRDYLWKWNPRLTALAMPTVGAMIAAKGTTQARYVVLQRLVTTDSPGKMTLEARVIALDKRRVAMLHPIPLGTNLSGVYVGALKLAKGVTKAVEGLGRVAAAPMPKPPKKKKKRRRRERR